MTCTPPRFVIRRLKPMSTAQAADWQSVMAILITAATSGGCARNSRR
jgi:hypothetical protein